MMHIDRRYMSAVFRDIDPSEIDGRRYVLLPRINEGLMLSEVPAWRCFNEEALGCSGVDFAKYADSEPYIYLDMAREQGEQFMRRYGARPCAR